MHESEEHAALVELFRHHPELAARLTAQVGHIELPPGYTTDVADPVIRAVTIAPDALAIVRDALGKPRLSIPIEVQLRVDRRKKKSWPLYLWHSHARQGCDSCVLVVTPKRSVAAWARRLIVGGPGNSLQVIVLGPDEVPRIVDLRVARADPALAVLSAAVHGNAGRGLPVIRAAAAALKCLPAEEAQGYARIVYCQLSADTVRKIHEDLMQDTQDVHDSHSHGDHYEYEGIPDEEDDERVYPLPDGWTHYCAEVKAEIEAAATAAATARMEVKTRVDVLLRQLALRGFTIDTVRRAEVLACKDVAQLDTWLDRVLFAIAASDVFRD